METTNKIPQIYSMSFASAYKLYINKAEKNGRNKAELNTVITWLTGYTQKKLDSQVAKLTNFENFFAQAPKLHPNRTLITGVICGIRIAEIKDLLMKEIRYLNKLVDELAKSRPLEKILRKSI
ncbi:DUF2200 domain-containing protein [Patescibacteria group bacterium]|nr:DUF2200 domain-containing protein [Patescibacteria group bacterium]